ncbi:phage holin family protein [Cardinium endosymbiont of Nabis limbatus]|uniref:phage holin family protein n=1 Tax=Cardinium endosymbiont of Nabis limbatus TaxID=3066217 RepID=UPI003AF339D1
MLCKLLGIACIVEMVRQKLDMVAYTFRHNLRAQAKKIAQVFLLVCLSFILLALGLCFLFLGLACWLNLVCASPYLGFVLVAIFCLVMFMLMVFILRGKINNPVTEQEEIMDHL